MSHKPNLLERAFDHLSAIPYLKVHLKGLFVVTILMMIVAFLFGDWGSQENFIKNALVSVFGNLFFAFIFRLWDRRDRERAKKT